MGFTLLPGGNHDNTPRAERGKVVETSDELERKRKHQDAVDREEAQLLLFKILCTLAILAIEPHQAQIQRLAGLKYVPGEENNIYDLLEETLDATKQLVDLPDILEGVGKGGLSYLEHQLEYLCESIAQRNPATGPLWIVTNPEVTHRIRVILRHFACIAIAQLPAEDLDEDFVPPQD